MIKNKKLVIFGTGELAELSHFYFTNDSEYEVVAFCLDEEFINSKIHLNLPIVNYKEIEKIYPIENYELFIAIGYSKLNENRREKYLDSKLKGYKLASYISSKSSYWPSLVIGDNTFIMESNTIMPFCKIGNNVLIWVNNDIAHHMVIEDHVTITSHCAIGGNVIIKEQSFIGLNSTIRNNIVIGKCSIIGAATNVTRDIKDFSLVMGNPAKSREIDPRKINLL